MKKYLVSLLAFILAIAMMTPVAATLGEGETDGYGYDDPIAADYDTTATAPADDAEPMGDWHKGDAWTAAQLERKFQSGAQSVRVGDKLLQADAYTGNVRLTDLSTGARIDTIPTLFEDGVETILDTTARADLFADIIVDYYYRADVANDEVGETSAAGTTFDGWRGTNSVAAYSSFTHSVAKDQLRVEPIENGFRMVYDFNVIGITIEPLVFSEEDFLKWTEKIEDPADLEITLGRYERCDFKEIREARTKAYNDLKTDKQDPVLQDAVSVANQRLTPINSYAATQKLFENGEKGVYYIFYGAGEGIGFTILTRREQQAIWAKTGMTVDDYMEICEHVNNFSNPYQEGGFTLVISYTIDEQGRLRYTQYNDEITMKAGFYLVNLNVCRYICGTFTDEEGYMVVPSGSGAVIDNDTTNCATTQANYVLYGNDNASTQYKGIPYREINALEVYGCVRNGMAVTGIIENDPAHVTLRTDLNYNVGNRPINVLSVQYSMTLYDSLRVSGDTLSMDYQLFPRRIVDGKAYGLIPGGNYSIVYTLSYGDEADYVHMADLYREYLLGKGMQAKVDADSTIPLFLDLYGAMERKKLFLSVPFTITQPLTTFEQAQEIIEYLKTECGVSDFAVRYLGWMNGGITSTAPTKVRPVGKLGGADGLKALSKYVAENGYDLYPDVNMVYVFRDEMFDGYDPNRMTSKRLDFVYAILSGTSLVSGDTDSKLWSCYVLSPKSYETVFNAFRTEADKKLPDLKSYAFSESGRSISSDFTINEYVYKGDSVKMVQKFLGQLEDEGYDLATENGNSCVLPYVSTVFRVPMSSSKLLVETEPIPLAQIVLHGCVRYTGESINEYQDDGRYLLKCLEYGMSPYVRLMYEEDTILRDTVMKDYYSLNYKDWTEPVKEIYAAVNKELAGLQTERITAHEKLAESVYATTYGGKTTIVVNYTDAAFDYNGTAVAPMGYAVVK